MEELNNTVQSISTELAEKVDLDNVNIIVHEKYEEVVQYLQDALQSSLEDENNFKKKADEISDLVTILTNSKADKTEINNMQELMVKSEALMKKIGNQMNIKDRLKDFISKKELESVLNVKVDRAEFEEQVQNLSTNARKSKKLAAVGNPYPPPVSDAITNSGRPNSPGTALGGPGGYGAGPGGTGYPGGVYGTGYGGGAAGANGAGGGYPGGPGGAGGYGAGGPGGAGGYGPGGPGGAGGYGAGGPGGAGGYGPGGPGGAGGYGGGAPGSAGAGGGYNGGAPGAGGGGGGGAGGGYGGPTGAAGNTWGGSGGAGGGYGSGGGTGGAGDPARKMSQSQSLTHFPVIAMGKALLDPENQASNSNANPKTPKPQNIKKY